MTPSSEWPAPDYWCTVCDRGTEGCKHTPADAAPRRIQLSRKKGWRKPENTVVVARPTRWGNPIRIAKSTVNGLPFAVYGRIGNLLGLHPTVAEAREHAVEVFGNGADSRNMHPIYPFADIEELRGKNLACWCPLDQPCHADVLLEIANRKDEV